MYNVYNICCLHLYLYYCSVVYVFYLHLSLQCCLCIVFKFILAVLSVYFCLLVYHFFIMVFIVILSIMNICKQVCLLQCFVFVTCIYNFNVKRCKSKTSVSWFLVFVTIFIDIYHDIRKLSNQIHKIDYIIHI